MNLEKIVLRKLSPNEKKEKTTAALPSIMAYGSLVNNQQKPVIMILIFWRKKKKLSKRPKGLPF